MQLSRVLSAFQPQSLFVLHLQRQLLAQTQTSPVTSALMSEYRPVLGAVGDLATVGAITFHWWPVLTESVHNVRAIHRHRAG
jgi:hypothetical protein